MRRCIKIVALMAMVSLFTHSTYAVTVTEEEKQCLMMASNLQETDFIALSSEYSLDESLVTELDYRACGYVLELEGVFENVWVLDVSDLNLTTLDLTSYPNLRYLDASNNELTDIVVGSDMEYIMVMDLSHNEMVSSDAIHTLLSNHFFELSINDNPISNNFYHDLHSLGVELEYIPEMTIYLDGIPQDTSKTVIHHVATSTDLSIEHKYTTTLTVQNATGTDLLYDNGIELLPGEYTIIASNEFGHVTYELSIAYPDIEETTPSQPSENTVPRPVIRPVYPFIPVIPDMDEIPEIEVEQEESEIIEEVVIDEVEVPEAVVEELEEEFEEEVEVESIEEDITPIVNEPILDELPNTSDGVNYTGMLGWLLIVFGVMMRVTLYIDEKKTRE